MQISDTVSVLANTTSDNVLLGNVNMFQQRSGQVFLSAIADATGILANWAINDVNVVNRSIISFGTLAGPPIRRDNLVTGVRIVRGAGLFISFTNITVGTLVVNWLLDIGSR